MPNANHDFPESIPGDRAGTNQDNILQSSHFSYLERQFTATNKAPFAKVSLEIASGKPAGTATLAYAARHAKAAHSYHFDHCALVSGFISSMFFIQPRSNDPK